MMARTECHALHGVHKFEVKSWSFSGIMEEGVPSRLVLRLTHTHKTLRKDVNDTIIDTTANMRV